MEKKQRVIVYGNTVVLAGIEARIKLDPNSEVVGHAQTGRLKDLVELHPDVVIFDVDEVQPEFLRAQLQSQPALLLIGIDPESHEVLLTGQAARSITLDQITKIMQNRDPPCAEESVPPGPGKEKINPTHLIRKKFPTKFPQGENHEHKNESP
jgi:DNA-binding NarL/FixJ family response regulator